MKEHFCPAEKSIITYQGECSWCGESEGSMTQEALKLALEGVEIHSPNSPEYIVCAALIEALAQPEQETAPVAKNEGGRITWLIDDWPQNCFLYSEPPSWTPVEIGVDVTPEGAHVVGVYVLPDAVRYVFYSKFHTTPPQRTWVDLTDETISEIAINNPPMVHEFARAIEAKLKELNT